MRTQRLAAGTVALMMVMTAGVAFAQGAGQGQGRGKRPGRADNPQHGAYDPGAIVSLSGTVEEVLLKPGRNGATGLHLLLATDEGTTEIAVGPTFYLFPQGLEIEKGDQIEVSGSEVAYDDGKLLLAREISEGSVALVLRDEKGKPAWRGQGPRSEGKDGEGKGSGCRGNCGEGRGQGGGSGCGRHGGNR